MHQSLRKRGAVKPLLLAPWGPCLRRLLTVSMFGTSEAVESQRLSTFILVSVSHTRLRGFCFLLLALITRVGVVVSDLARILLKNRADRLYTCGYVWVGAGRQRQ